MRAWAMAVLAAIAAAGTARAQPAAAPPMTATPPVDYTDPHAWICRPGVDDGTCSTNLDAVTVDAVGTRTPRPFRPDPAPKIDCFYVYPTASDDPGEYSDLQVDRSEERSVHGQAARLAERCRLFVPAYHQLTLAALHWHLTHPGTPSSFAIPYRDVRDAWASYLRHDNGGRGVVLIGHSQGAILLKRLLAEEIDGKPAQARLVGAYLAGNLDLTATSFRALRPCTASGQTGCVTAWSSYLDGTGGARFFGGGAGALCTNPAAPGGGRALLDAFLPRPATASPDDPPYVELRGQLSAACVADGAGQVLRVRVEPGRYHDLLAAALAAATRPNGWGLHPLDISLVQGDLLADIGAQAARWR